MPLDGTLMGFDELINDLKSEVSLWEDLVIKSSKFSMATKIMATTCSDLLDSINCVCNIACKNVFGLRNTGISLTKLVLRERNITIKINNFAEMLREKNMEMEKFINDWKRSSVMMKKDRDNEWKRSKTDYQKSVMELERTEKKLRRKTTGNIGLASTTNLQIEFIRQELDNKRRYAEDLEQCLLRRAISEERGRFKHFLRQLRPLLDWQISLYEDIPSIKDVIEQLYGDKADDLDYFPDELLQRFPENLNETLDCKKFLKIKTQLLNHSSVSNDSIICPDNNSICTALTEFNNDDIMGNTFVEVSPRVHDNVSNQTPGLSTAQIPSNNESSAIVNDSDKKKSFAEKYSRQTASVKNQIEKSNPNRNVNGETQSQWSINYQNPGSSSVLQPTNDTLKRTKQSKHVFISRVPSKGGVTTGLVSPNYNESSTFFQSGVIKKKTREVEDTSPAPCLDNIPYEMISISDKISISDNESPQIGDEPPAPFGSQNKSRVTKMKPPSTSKQSTKFHRNSIQNQIPGELCRSRNQERSMSANKIFEDDEENTEELREDFNQIRQRMAGHIESVKFIKHERSRQEVSKMTSSDYPMNLVSPIMTRSNRPSTKMDMYSKRQQQRCTRGYMDQCVESDTEEEQTYDLTYKGRKESHKHSLPTHKLADAPKTHVSSFEVKNHLYFTLPSHSNLSQMANDQVVKSPNTSSKYAF